MTTEARFDYAGPYKSRERAEASLDDSFAAGDVSEAERPAIESRNTAKGRRYFITLPM